MHGPRHPRLAASWPRSWAPLVIFIFLRPCHENSCTLVFPGPHLWMCGMHRGRNENLPIQATPRLSNHKSAMGLLGKPKTRDIAPNSQDSGMH